MEFCPSPAEYQRRGFWGVLARLLEASSWEALLMTKDASVRFSLQEPPEPMEAGEKVSRGCKDNEVALGLAGGRLSLLLRGVGREEPEVCEKTRSALQFYLETMSVEDLFSPGFIPYYLPLTERTAALNALLASGERLLFLNGRNGSGRMEFVERFIFLRFAVFPLFEDKGDSLFFAAENGFEVRVVKEVARLSEERQLELQKECANDGVQCFFLSEYPLEALRERDLILSDFSRLMGKNHVLFRSPGHRGDEAEVFSYRQSLSAVKSQEWDVFSGGLREAVESLERRALLSVYQEPGVSQYDVAKRLGISRGSLQHKLKKYGLDVGQGEDVDV